MHGFILKANEVNEGENTLLPPHVISPSTLDSPSPQDCRKFEDLPPAAQAYVRKVEELVKLPGEMFVRDADVNACRRL